MRPGIALVWLLAAWSLLGFACAMGWLPISVWQISGGALLAVALVDAWTLSRLATPIVRRILPGVIPVGVERDATLQLEAGDVHAVTVDVHDLLPGDWPVHGLPRTLKVTPGVDSPSVIASRPHGVAVLNSAAASFACARHCACGGSAGWSR